MHKARGLVFLDRKYSGIEALEPGKFDNILVVNTRTELRGTRVLPIIALFRYSDL